MPLLPEENHEAITNMEMPDDEQSADLQTQDYLTNVQTNSDINTGELTQEGEIPTPLT